MLWDKRMNSMEISILSLMLGCVWLPTAQAEELASLPTIKVMAEAELREEIGSLPFQEDKDVRKALERKIMKSEQDIQNYVIGDNIGVIDIKPPVARPDMSGISPLLQQYVMAVASGLQSSDPTTGLFTMLEPVSMGIDRDKAIQAVKNGSFQLNVDMDRLKLMIGNDKLQSSLPK